MDPSGGTCLANPIVNTRCGYPTLSRRIPIFPLILSILVNIGPLALANQVTSPTDSPIDDFIKVDIGGVPQQLWIKGNDQNQPLVLFLHGGPGEPHMDRANFETQLLENDFIVVHWDQRGAGVSYSEQIDPSSLTVPQMISDTVKVIEYLTTRFDRERVFLVGHSWGAYLGMKVSYAHPELIYAYTALGLPVNMVEAYKVLKNKLIQEVDRLESELGTDQRESSRLKGIQKVRTTLSRFDIERIIEDRDRDAFFEGYFEPRFYLGFRAAKFLFWPGKINPHLADQVELYSQSIDRGIEISDDLFFDFIQDDISKYLNEVQIPIFAIHGRDDYNVEPYMADRYIKHDLKAPCKKSIWFEKSAHLISFDQPKDFKRIMIEQVKEVGLRGCSALTPEAHSQ